MRTSLVAHRILSDFDIRISNLFSLSFVFQNRPSRIRSRGPHDAAAWMSGCAAQV